MKLDQLDPEVTVPPASNPVIPVHTETAEESVTTTILVSEKDSYIREKMKGQPRNLSEIEQRAEVTSVAGRHRLALPEFFEKHSHDCTWGDGCSVHKAGKVKFLETTRGRYMFRRQLKDKRSLDAAVNITGWSFVNKTLFPDAPRELFSPSGGVEEGDTILLFLPAKKALEIRRAPGKRSRELIGGQIRPSKKAANRVVMSAGEDNETHYEPDMSAEAGEGSSSPPGIMEGRDF